MTTQRRSNKPTLLAARRSIEAMHEKVRAYEQIPGLREVALHFIDSDDMRPPAHLRDNPYFSPAFSGFGDIMATARDSGIFHLWGRTKVVYAMDGDMLGYLSQSVPATVPSHVLRSLPHADPYVLLPQAAQDDTETAYYREHIGVPWGAFVFGRYNDAQQMCSTRDERREDLGLMFIGPVEVLGEKAIVQTLRCTIPLRGPTIRVEDAVDATIARFAFNQYLGQDKRQQLEGWLRRYVTQVFSCLLYVCTDQPDIEVYRPGLNQAGKISKRGQRQQRRPKPDDIESVVQLGFRLGPALTAARRQWEQRQPQRSRQGSPGASKRPHQKRGHYRTYWTGVGRQVPRVKWIAPFWVHPDLLSDDAEPREVVVRPVRPKS